MASTTQITLVDKLMVIPVTARAATSAVVRAVTRPFVGGAKATTYFKDVVFAALRTNLSLMSVGTEQWMNPRTEATYLDFAKKQGFQPDTDVLASGLKLHWLGNKSADKIILYFHGYVRRTRRRVQNHSPVDFPSTDPANLLTICVVADM